MLAAATVTPVIFSQKLSGKRNLPPDSTEPPAAFDNLKSGFVVAQTDYRDEKGSFVDASGAYLINSDAVRGVATPYVPDRETILSSRTTLNLLGDGYVETTAGETLEQLVRSQADGSGGCIAGQVIRVPLLEASGQSRVRVGWKNQMNGLISLSAGATPRRWGLLRPERHNTSRRR
jgi:hypothetical protein